VAEESEPGAWAFPDRSNLTGDLPGRDRRRGLPALPGTVADDGQHQHGDQRTARRRCAERDRPAGAVQQQGERHRGQDLPELAEDGGALGDQRYAARREPARDQGQHRGEHEGVTHAHQNPGRNGGRQPRSERQQQLAGGQQYAADHQHHPRAVSVDEQAGRDERNDIDRDLDEDEGGQRPGLTSNLWAASSPATPSEVRRNTVST